jgi:hypothetical protein
MTLQSIASPAASDDTIIAVTRETNRRILGAPKGSAERTWLVEAHKAFVDACMPETGRAADYFFSPDVLQQLGLDWSA